MPAPKTPDRGGERRRFPLHVHIAVVFIALLVLAGGILSWYNYAQTSRIVLSAANRVFDEVHRQVIADLNHGVRLNHTTVDLLARSPLAQARGFEAQRATLPLLRDALRRNPGMASVYAGYDDGGFFQFTPLRADAQRARFEAPADAHYVIWSLEPGARTRTTSRYLFLDADLNVVSQRPVPAEDFDPRARPWYRAALRADGQLAVTRPYVFATAALVGATVARRAPAGGTVVAGDVLLEALDAALRARPISPSAELALFTADGDVVAYRGADEASRHRVADKAVSLASIARFPVLAALVANPQAADRSLEFMHDERPWIGIHRRVEQAGERRYRLVIAAPREELVAEAARIRDESLAVTALLLVGVLPLGWVLSRRVATPLRALADEANAIEKFDFHVPLKMRSEVLEIDQLAGAMRSMKSTINNFLEISTDLSGERRFDALLERVAGEMTAALDADGAAVYLLSDDGRSLQPVQLHLPRSVSNPGPEALQCVALRPTPSATGLAGVARQAGVQRFAVDTRALATPQAASALAAALGGERLLAHGLALTNPKGETVGALALLHEARRSDLPQKTAPERLAFVVALAGVAAAAIDNQRLYKAQKDLLDSFIRLVAGAIDAKSPYTGGHCQRVPELTRMLARAAAESDAPSFREFALSDDDWEALDIACWLHDCGKVTTPEYVVDKATKLETIYDRLHEIRMRFEVLKRDAEVEHWKALAAGGDRAQARARLEAEWRTLDEEFAFVAACNEGGEFMAPERIARLQQIARRSWLRTLDDRIGLSWEERARKDRHPAPALPVTEPLLADRADHVIERPPAEDIAADNPWGFRLDVPAHKYNRGELYNLSVRRGTLTAEERYVINHHIVQTIVMLSRLPFPSHLRAVPEYAGAHHETLDGTGYPRRLRAEDMSLPARMMAIADIFEALTARDRPYKRPKKLSEAVRIMAAMVRERHIDPALFSLFLSAGVYRDYAERFLDPEQIDAVDVSEYLGSSGSDPCG